MEGPRGVQGSGLAVLEVSCPTWPRDGYRPWDPSGQAKEPEVGMLPSPLPLCVPSRHQNPPLLRTSSTHSPEQDMPALTPAHSLITSASRAKRSTYTGPLRLCDPGQVTARL